MSLNTKFIKFISCVTWHDRDLLHFNKYVIFWTLFNDEMTIISLNERWSNCFAITWKWRKEFSENIKVPLRIHCVYVCKTYFLGQETKKGVNWNVYLASCHSASQQRNCDTIRVTLLQNNFEMQESWWTMW